jgi:2-amino-4-hydroxy-6-hydroxymethyldihydropteridine diphosphokinase
LEGSGDEEVFVGLGGNLGSEAEILERFDDVHAELAVFASGGRIGRSGVYRSRPAGPVADQPDFLNQVINFLAPPDLEPRALLAILRAIEDRYGRTRTVPQGPRTLDLDLLLFGERVINEPDLVVPHPRIGHRPFVLAPLLDLLGGPPERLF